MNQWSSRNRGMFLETLINKTLKFYADHEIGIFHKKDVPIVFSGIKQKPNGKPEIERGWIASRSTADYYGVYQGRFIAFEAKSTNLTALPLSNIKDHQLTYLEQINHYGGLGFLIIGFAAVDEYYAVHPQLLTTLSCKSLALSDCQEQAYRIKLIYPGILDFEPYLELWQKK